MLKLKNKDYKFKDIDLDTRFDILTKAQQTVLASVAFQYGSNLKSKTKNFWKQVTSGDWDSAIKNLENFGDKYSSRRNREADLLKEEKNIATVAFKKSLRLIFFGIIS